MPRLDPAEQTEARLIAEWLQYCQEERDGQYSPLDYETWLELEKVKK